MIDILKIAGDIDAESWDITTHQGGVIWQSHLDWITALAFSPDGQFLAAGNWDGTVKVWEAATGREQAILEGRPDVVTVLAFSADNRRLAAGYRDQKVMLWELAPVGK